MSNIKRHKGIIKNTGSRCIVVFREIPDDPDHCLIIQQDALPEIYGLATAKVVDNEGQGSADLYEVLNRHSMPTGENMLSALHNNRLLRKYPTKNIVMQLTPEYNIQLDQLNAQIRGEPNETTVNDNDIQSKFNPYAHRSADVERAESDGIAQRLIAEAEDLHFTADQKLERAYRLRPELRPAEPLISAEDIAALQAEAVPEFKEGTITIDLTSMSQRKATELLKEEWQRLNKKAKGTGDEE